MSPRAGDPIAEATALFRARGDSHYGEGVSQTEHALQAAACAVAEQAPAALVIAALFHDVGHLLQKLGEDAADRGLDSRHEDIGAAWLAHRFVPQTAAAVRLHVAAKRFLCATEPGYEAALSDASRRSLALQGGRFSPEAAAAFAALPGAADAVRLRRWDDAAKVVGAVVPGFEAYAGLGPSVSRLD